MNLIKIVKSHKLNRVFALLLALLLVGALCAVVSADTPPAPEFRLTADPSSPAPGDAFGVAVSVENVGCASVQAVIAYDADKVSYEGGSTPPSGTLITHDAAKGELFFSRLGGAAAGEKLFELPFKVRQSVNGTASFTVTGAKYSLTGNTVMKTMSAPPLNVVINAPAAPRYLVQLAGNLTVGTLDGFITTDAPDGMAADGDIVTVTFDPGVYTEYDLTSLKYDNTVINPDTDGVYKFVMPAKMVTISAEFRRVDTYNVSFFRHPEDIKHGTIGILPERSSYTRPGAEVVIEAVPEPGYTLKNIRGFVVNSVGGDIYSDFDIQPVGGDKYSFRADESLEGITRTKKIYVAVYFENADVTEWQGAGTEANPYLIQSNEDLILLRERVNNALSYKGKFFRLVNNLDLTTSEANWTAIGAGSGANVSDGSPVYGDQPFAGTFDGNGKTINLRLDRPIQEEHYDEGVFGLLSGTLRNLTVTGEVIGHVGVAAVVKNIAWGGLIENCVNYANVTASESNVGGIVGVTGGATIPGRESTPVRILNCKNYGKVTVQWKAVAGGIVSDAGAGTEIIGCINYGDVTGVFGARGSADIAGIVAAPSINVRVENCGNEGEIKGATAYGIGQAGEITGGYNTGNITGSSAAAGIARGDNTTKISDCFNTGRIVTTESLDFDVTERKPTRAGGITAMGPTASGVYLTITNCYNAGVVDGAGNSGGIAGGALTGYEGRIYVSNSYYLNTTAEQTMGGQADTPQRTAQAVTSAELSALAPQLGMAFKYQAFGYPLLVWQTADNGIRLVVESAENGVVTARVGGDEIDARNIEEDGTASVALEARASGAISKAAVTVDPAALNALAEAEASFTLRTDVGSYGFNSAAVKELAQTASARAFVLTAERLSASRYRLTLTVGGLEVWSANGGAVTGSVTVMLPYTRRGAASAVNVKAYQVLDGGTRTELASGYSDTGKTVSFTASGAGAFAIEEIEKPAVTPAPDSGVWDGVSIDVSWYDRSRSEYHIKTPAQLMGLAAIVNGLYNPETTTIVGDKSVISAIRVQGGSGADNNMSTTTYHYGADDFTNKTVYLDNDLDMGGPANNFMPIGGQYLMERNNYGTKISSSFNGVFDGGGHWIRNIYTDRNCDTGNYGDGSSVGLIGRLGVHDGDAANIRPRDPAVRNVAVTGYIRGNRSVGGIVGKIGKTSYNNGDGSTGGIVENCANFAVIEATDSKGVGGIVGASWNGGLVRNCYNAGSVTGGWPVGGIVGSNEITVENCYNIGTIRSARGGGYAMAIGTKNGDYGHSVDNVYYRDGDAPGGGYYSEGSAKNEGIRTEKHMTSEDFVIELNSGGRTKGDFYVMDAYNINGGFPVLAWQGGKPVDDTQNTDDEDKPNETVAPGTTTVKDDAATTIVDDPVPLGSDPTLVVINVETNGATVNTITAEVTAENVKAIAENGSAIEVRSDLGNVTLPSAAVKDLAGSAEKKVDVKLTKNSADTYTLALTADDKAVQTVDGGVKLTLPAENVTPGTVAVLVNADGTEEVIKKSVGKDGKVSIPLDGSATVKIVDNAKAFSDVTDDAWYADGVKFTSSHELFQGDEGRFSPNASMTRGMLVTVLHRLENEPNAAGELFSDVAENTYYAEAIIWASANAIVNGVGDGRFAPETAITREQLAVMLYRYYVRIVGDGVPDVPSEPLDAFPDADEVSDWAEEALKWAVAAGLIQGRDSGLAPKGTATRAEVAVILERFIENIL